MNPEYIEFEDIPVVLSDGSLSLLGLACAKPGIGFKKLTDEFYQSIREDLEDRWKKWLKSQTKRRFWQIFRKPQKPLEVARYWRWVSTTESPLLIPEQLIARLDIFRRCLHKQALWTGVEFLADPKTGEPFCYEGFLVVESSKFFTEKYRVALLEGKA